MTRVKSSIKKESVVIRNSRNEILETLVVYPEEGYDETVVFVHGFGADLNENGNLIKDMVNLFQPGFRCIQFSFSGYGKSEGRQEDVTIEKMKGDLRSILSFAMKPGKKVRILAHSLGALVTTEVATRENCSQLILTSPSNIYPVRTIKRIQDRIVFAGGELNENGISIYPRTSGEVQRVGADFWKELKTVAFADKLHLLSLDIDVRIFVPSGDEVVKQEGLSFFDQKQIWHKVLPGDHNFMDKEEREDLFDEILKTLAVT